MNYLKNGVILFALFLFTSCMDEDSSRISNSFDVQPYIAIPLIHSTTTLGDLLPDDEHISTDDDGLIRITYREDSIVQVESDSLLQIENQVPTEESFLLGAIDLTDFDIAMHVALSEIIGNLEGVLAAQINNAIALAQSSGLGIAYFPPITPQSGGVYTQTGSDKFESVLITEGTLGIEITNNFPIEISSLQLQLLNTIDQSVLGTFSFNDIGVGATKTSSINLSNSLMYNQLDLEVVELSSDGSGSNPLDQTTWVPVSGAERLDITISGSSIRASEGMVKFLEQEGPEDVFVVDMEFEDDAEISLIELSAGNFVYSFESTVNTVLELTIEIPQLVDEMETAFSEVIQVENTTSIGAQTISLPLDNYKFDFSGSVNQLQVSYSSQILGTNTFESYNQDDEVNISIGMEGLEFSYIEGYFGQIEEEIEEGLLDMDVSVLDDIASGIRLESPNLRFTVDNTIGIPFEIDLDLTSVNEGETVSLNGPMMEIASDATTLIDFNNTNSQLSDLIALNSSEISYSGSVLSNPLGNTGEVNSISSGTNITIGFEMDLPLHMRVEEAGITDTLVLDFGDENDEDSVNDYLESVKLKLRIENEFPLDIDVTVMFADSVSGSVLDSLNIESFEAAEVDENDRTITAKVFETDIVLDADQIDALFNANRALLDIKMNSYDSENTAVRLYTDYEFIVGIGVILELKIEE